MAPLNHRFIRAYMAGVLLPTWVLLAILAIVISGALPAEADRALIFPMAVVPNLWGLWNVLHTALAPRRIPIGVFGAALPAILAPAGLGLASALDLHFYTARDMLVVLPVAMAAYYLAWKYAVSFFNRAAGL
jgi:hypothetical protein